jgi:sugar lactone lactonase YvrE
MRGLRVLGRILGLLVLAAAMGCGGAKTGWAGAPGGASQTGGPTRDEAGTARFEVDVATGKVTVTPLGGGNAAGRAVFSGSAVTFESSTLVDDPGNTGLKVLSVKLRNNWGATLGQNGAGNASGLRVFFADFSDSATDVRDRVTVSTVAGTTYPGMADGAPLAAKFSGPTGVACGPDGAVYIADRYNHRIRVIRDQAVSTLAGNGTKGWKDGTGSVAQFNEPYGLAWHAGQSALVVTEYGGHTVRRVTPAGVVTTIAGQAGTLGTADGQGNLATFSGPSGVVVDRSGTIWVADTRSSRLRQITRFPSDYEIFASGWQVTTVSGTAGSGYVNGALAAARFREPQGLALGPDDAVYVADNVNHRVRRIANGSVATVAGTGAVGSADGPGDVATLKSPRLLAWTPAGLVVADFDGHNLRLIEQRDGSEASLPSNWLVRTLAGGSQDFADGRGDAARFSYPTGLTLAPDGALLIAEHGNARVRRLVPVNGLWASLSLPPGDERVRLTNADGSLPGPAPFIDYRWSTDHQGATPPGGVASSGSILAAGELSPARPWWFVVPAGVRSFGFKVTVEATTPGLLALDAVVNAGPGGAGSSHVMVSTLAVAANTPILAGASLDGSNTSAQFNAEAVAVDRNGVVYFADRYSHQIKRHAPGGQITTIAGTPVTGPTPQGGHADGSGYAARFSTPEGIAVNDTGTVVFVADTGNHVVRRLASLGGDPSSPASWTVSTIAGAVGQPGYVNYLGNDARLYWPSALCWRPGDRLYVLESNRVRIVQYNGTGDPATPGSYSVRLLAGSTADQGGASGIADGVGAAALFNQPRALAADRDDNVYVADTVNARIRKVAPDGTVSTIAGPPANAGGVPSGYVDGRGTDARFDGPFGIAVDTAGYVFVADSGNRRLRRISQAGGQVATVAGNGAEGLADGTGASCTLVSPTSLALAPDGDLVFLDNSGQRIRRVTRIVHK